MIDRELFTELQELYNENIKLFESQNTGLLIDKIKSLHESDIEKALEIPENVLVDKKYIFEHFINFTVNPQITELQKGFTTRVEISPDISWEIRK